ncbi:MAG: acetyl-CoA carboxylase carboxyltransferase subunit beta [Bacteroidetes bacterium]|nr:acetyl-CoA carboxylase carboxyltransferase subunit beta [Bacteroidota bacterium]
MGWWQRIKEGITTTTTEKKEAPDGVWYKCETCKKAVTVKEHKDNLFVCGECGYHSRIGSLDYFEILYGTKYIELFDNLTSTDYLKFKDLKTYTDRLKDAYEKTNADDAIRVAAGRIKKIDLVTACMDFSFIGGSMGSVVGEKISRSITYCIENNLPLLVISKSGGARMMESAFSLMQMAKTSAKLTQLADAKLPYISLMTDPTTGGVTASFAMLGDINIAEPGALIGFAGPRVIKETIKKDLPKGFQSSEFLLEHGFLDLIVNRKDLKEKIEEMILLFQN